MGITHNSKKNKLRLFKKKPETAYHLFPYIRLVKLTIETNTREYFFNFKFIFV